MRDAIYGDSTLYCGWCDKYDVHSEDTCDRASRPLVFDYDDNGDLY